LQGNGRSLDAPEVDPLKAINARNKRLEPWAPATDANAAKKSDTIASHDGALAAHIWKVYRGHWSLAFLAGVDAANVLPAFSCRPPEINWGCGFTLLLRIRALAGSQATPARHRQ
jgi:hypothetical protein